MSIPTICRAALAATLTILAVPAWAQSYRHAPATGAGRGSLSPVSFPIDLSSIGGTLSPTQSWSTAPTWTPTSSWTPVSYGSILSSSTIGPRPLPSRLHSSAFVFKRPTYKPSPQQYQQHQQPQPMMPQLAAQPMTAPSAMSHAAYAPVSRQQMMPSPHQVAQPPVPVPVQQAAAGPVAAAVSPAAHPTSAAPMQPVRQRTPPQHTPHASRPAEQPMSTEEMAQYGQSREAVGDWAGAIAVYDALAQREPSQPRWRVRRAECHYYAGQYELATADYRMAAVSIRLAYDEFARFGDAALRIGDYATAERALAALSRATDEPTPQVELLRGVAMLRQGNTRAARNILLRASGRWPDDPSITEALRIASAAHYGDRPLPVLDDERRRPETAPVMNADSVQPAPYDAASIQAVPIRPDAADAVSNAAQTLVEPPAGWRPTPTTQATRPTSAKSWSATKPQPAANDDAFADDAFADPPAEIIETSAEIAVPAEIDEFAAVRSQPVNPTAPRAWRAAQ